MPRYLMTYHGGNPPASREEGQRHFAKYQEWIGTLGEAAVSPMNPIKNTQLVVADGQVKEGGVSNMSGYTIVETDSMEAALEMAKKCPFLAIGGSLEVSEMVQMG